MLTRILLVFAIALTIAGALAAPKLMNTQTSGVLQQPVSQPRRVEVQQTLIRPVEVVEVRRGASARPSPTAGVRATRVKRPSGTFIAKATRSLIGDGRYRPEPFPRAR